MKSRREYILQNFLFSGQIDFTIESLSVHECSGSLVPCSSRRCRAVPSRRLRGLWPAARWSRESGTEGEALPPIVRRIPVLLPSPKAVVSRISAGALRVARWRISSGIWTR
ncbi:hypothetical protein AXF42_Ash012184 [Apostasia shenzhenica]|uniref:Uncharacterized protein n=1 Tax=Apostasia shenzhenica TaxID=1088818 RepID=A0A2I0B478_9ASPA|nr:hypothetical protein AXF42_Ash012184 [Apostasia shenzhenica]